MGKIGQGLGIRQKEKWERKRTSADWVWDDLHECNRYNWTYGNWSLFDGRPYEAAHSLTHGYVLDPCTMCSGMGVVGQHDRVRHEPWMPPNIFFKVLRVGLMQNCPDCGGAGCIPHKTS